MRLAKKPSLKLQVSANTHDKKPQKHLSNSVY